MGDSLKAIIKNEEKKKVGDTLLPKFNIEKTKHIIRKENIKRLKIKKKEKKIRKKERTEPLVPKTIETQREPDTTIVANIPEETERDYETDEFGSYFAKEYEPKILITFSENPVKASRKFAIYLSKIIPNSMLIGRKKTSIKSIIKSCIRKKFTDILVINEDRFEPNGLLIIHLPEGPTAFFRLSNMKICNKRQVKELTSHRPEVILNNFTTRLGATVGRMLGSLFHYHPDFKGRRVVTFHNQRDYIFFRHHRYKFLKGKPALRELGPRFTLRLEWLQKGTFDSKCGEYDWTIFGRRHELETSRRKFFL
ncbi:hypothetical protein PGB90_007496 [Kerria lacca]